MMSPKWLLSAIHVCAINTLISARHSLAHSQCAHIPIRFVSNLDLGKKNEMRDNKKHKMKLSKSVVVKESKKSYEHTNTNIHVIMESSKRICGETT